MGKGNRCKGCQSPLKGEMRGRIRYVTNRCYFFLYFLILSFFRLSLHGLVWLKFFFFFEMCLTETVETIFLSIYQPACILFVLVFLYICEPSSSIPLSTDQLWTCGDDRSCRLWEASLPRVDTDSLWNSQLLLRADFSVDNPLVVCRAGW